MADLHIENANLREMINELRRGIAMIHEGLATPSRPRQSVGEVAAWWLRYADQCIEAIAKPAPEPALSEVERDGFGRPVKPATP